MPGELFHPYKLVESICQLRDVSFSLYLSILFYQRRYNNLSYANSADSDQTLHIAASDLGLHCLPVLLLWDIRQICQNLTLKAPVMTAADDIHKYFFIVFQRK